MSAALLAEALRALVPLAIYATRIEQGFACDNGFLDHFRRLRAVLRKAAPCEMCDGLAGSDAPGPDMQSHGWSPCITCCGAGWTQASLDAAIAGMEHQDG